MTQSTSHLANSPELSWPIWTVVSFPKFWLCKERQTIKKNNNPVLITFSMYTAKITHKRFAAPSLKKQKWQSLLPQQQSLLRVLNSFYRYHRWSTRVNNWRETTDVSLHRVTTAEANYGLLACEWMVTALVAWNFWFSPHHVKCNPLQCNQFAPTSKEPLAHCFIEEWILTSIMLAVVSKKGKWQFLYLLLFCLPDEQNQYGHHTVRSY